MPEFPETSDSLIALVRDPMNRAAWEQFEQIYRPVIFRIARAKGMQHADAFDLVQQVLFSVAMAIERFEKQKDGTRFRNWLSRVTRNAIINALTRSPKELAVGGTEYQELLKEVSTVDPETEQLIQLEYRRELFCRASEQVRQEIQESTWLAFEMTVVQQQPLERVAKTLDISMGSLYAARSRVMRRIRNAVSQLEQQENEDVSDETN